VRFFIELETVFWKNGEFYRLVIRPARFCQALILILFMAMVATKTDDARDVTVS